MLSKFHRITLLAGVAASVMLAQAADPSFGAALGYDYSGGGTVGNMLSTIGAPSGVGTEGFEFAITSPTVITALGIWDKDGDGLATAHTVGIYANGAPGVSNTFITIPAGTVGTLVNGFRFVSLPTPVTLSVFGDYYMGAFYPDLQDKMAWSVPDSSLTLNGGFDWTRPFASDQSKFSTTTSGIAFPTGNAGRSRGVIGPNFLTGVLPTPEPASLSVLAIGGTALLARRRRRA